MKISIITAVFNRADTVTPCIQSVLAQSYPSVESIVVDGGSTDGTLQKIQNCGGRIAHLVSEPDLGVYDALNKGIALATGDVIGFLHSDDLYAHPDVLATVIHTLAHTGADSCYGNLVYIDPADSEKIARYWKACPFHRTRFLFGWMPPHPTFFVRRSIYDQYGGFNLSLGSAADYELMLRFLYKHDITTAYINEVLVKMRMGGLSNASIKNRLRANRMDRLAWRVNGLHPLFWTLYLKPFRKILQYYWRPGNRSTGFAKNSLYSVSE